jgi:hypothetical protein
MKQFFFLVLFFIGTQHSFGLGFGKSRNGNVFIEDGCSKIQQQVDDLISWTKRVENRTCTAPEIRNGAEGTCTANVTQCVPKMVKENHGTNSEHPGPNCWNTALVMQGLIPGLRETSSEEFEFFIKSPLCKELGPNEEKKPGDIGSIETPYQDGSSNQIHAFIHINDNMIYNKVGLALQSPFTLQSYKDMHENYPLELTGECKSDCTLPETFRYLMDYRVFKFLQERDPNFKMPDPKVTCNAVNKAPDKARELIPLLINEEELGFTLADPPEMEIKTEEMVFSVDEETGESTSGYQEVTRRVSVDIVSQIINACDKYKRRAEDIATDGSTCKKYCAKPVVKHYRCDKPEEYLSKFNDRSKDFYKDLNEILLPIDCNLEAHLLTNKTNIDTIKNLFTNGLNAVNQYVSQEVGDLETLSEPEKRSLAMIAIRLDEIGYQIGEQNEVRSELGEVYTLSRSFLPRRF